ncbi:TetR/AcrR family transcriptional regulator [Kordiimonas pumila]|uniref:TetR/AcrR family transcriptional regulator n=1 Tax=Kordiimonas pumila TaxID=2161677 RepID=A0ABV7D9F4_9PROT|nr:TetR/AcrR family transcriptional regulator [Kordiimonas pumila]
MVNTTKIPAKQWLETAKNALINEGIAGVRVDRLAKTLGVTRGGFYHNFKNREDLLDQLLNLWATNNKFIPDTNLPSTPEEAVAYLNLMLDWLISEESFSPTFDLAIREWARVDTKADKFLSKIDQERLNNLANVFMTIGCEKGEAQTRAKVFYYHQIGYYSMGHHVTQDKNERRLEAPIYLRILCGQRYQDANDKLNQKWL